MDQMNDLSFKEPQHQEVESPKILRAFEKLRQFAERNSETKGAIESAIDKLQKSGVTSDEIFNAIDASEFQKLTKLPVAVSRAAYKAATHDHEGGAVSRGRPSVLRAQTMSLEALVSLYDPVDVGSPTHRELASRLQLNPSGTSSPKVFEFSEDGGLDVKRTLERISVLLSGEEEALQLEDLVSGRIAFGVGELPNAVVGVHPITGEQLFFTGKGRDGLDWEGTDVSCRQLLALARESDELESSMTRGEALRLFRLCKDKDGLTELMLEFPNAAQRFNERRIIGGLPTLKAFRNSISAREDETDPVQLSKGRFRYLP